MVCPLNTFSFIKEKKKKGIFNSHMSTFTKSETDVCNADSAMCKFLFLYVYVYIYMYIHTEFLN